MEIGIVEDYLPNRKFGFIRTPSEEQIFFMLSDMRRLLLSDSKIVFGNEALPEPLLPKRGQHVVFQRTTYHGSNPDIKAKAAAWDYHAVWKALEQELIRCLDILPLEKLAEEARIQTAQTKRVRDIRQERFWETLKRGADRA